MHYEQEQNTSVWQPDDRLPTEYPLRVALQIYWKRLASILKLTFGISVFTTILVLFAWMLFTDQESLILLCFLGLPAVIYIAYTRRSIIVEKLMNYLESLWLSTQSRRIGFLAQLMGMRLQRLRSEHALMEMKQRLELEEAKMRLRQELIKLEYTGRLRNILHVEDTGVWENDKESVHLDARRQKAESVESIEPRLTERP